MLGKIDLDKELLKDEYKLAITDLRRRLLIAQEASWVAKIPVVILIEGWDAAGKGAAIQELTQPLDPRGFKLYPIRPARTSEKKRPWLWRFWQKLPARGEWAIFDRSWYGRVLVERVEAAISESEWRRAYRDILDFERTIAEDNHLIVKFFLHLSKAEQKRRFEKLSKEPLTAWRVTQEDWEQHRHYDDWLLAYEEMLERTDSEWGPWTIVEATDKRYAREKILRTVLNALEARLGPIPVHVPQAPPETPDVESPVEEEAEPVEALPLAGTQASETIAGSDPFDSTGPEASIEISQ